MMARYKKQLYAALGIAEYWVIDVRGSQVFFFLLGDQGQYHEVGVSSILPGLDASLLEDAISKLDPPGKIGSCSLVQQANCSGR